MTQASETIRNLDLDFLPHGNASSAVLLQDERSAFLIFNAWRPAEYGPRPEGGLRAWRRPVVTRKAEDFLAICTFDLCSATHFGYPNDEPRASIARLRKLAAVGDMVEILNSSWDSELQRLNLIGFPDRPRSPARHFVFLFKDSTFECLADGLEFELSTDNRSTVIERVAQRLR
jgi:hypothetical protein